LKHNLGGTNLAKNPVFAKVDDLTKTDWEGSLLSQEKVLGIF
jgi:hypothetical protein